MSSSVRTPATTPRREPGTTGYLARQAHKEKPQQCLQPRIPDLEDFWHQWLANVLQSIVHRDLGELPIKRKQSGRPCP